MIKAASQPATFLVTHKLAGKEKTSGLWEVVPLVIASDMKLFSPPEQIHLRLVSCFNSSSQQHFARHRQSCLQLDLARSLKVLRQYHNVVGWWRQRGVIYSRSAAAGCCRGSFFLLSAKGFL